MSKKNKTGLVIIVFLLLLTAVYRLFVDRPGRRTFEATVALSSLPPAAGDSSSPDAFDSLTIYRTGRGGTTCFETFHSPELREMFSPKNGQQVMVEYDTFSDFGKVRGYNVHSIDGFVLANGYHLVRPDYGAGSGAVIGPGQTSASGDYCW